MRHLFAIVVVLSLACTALAGAGRRTIVVDADAPIDAAQSAALFVGVREFTYDTTLAEVRYAVDDAVAVRRGVEEDASGCVHHGQDGRRGTSSSVSAP